MRKVLIVDDTRTVHMFIRSITKGEPLDFIDAYNGEEALGVLTQEKPDLVLLDWEMPVMNGPETITKIVELYPSLPVVMMTTRNSHEDISSMMAAGAREYLMKPFTKELLLEKIQEASREEFDDVI